MPGFACTPDSVGWRVDITASVPEIGLSSLSARNQTRPRPIYMTVRNVSDAKEQLSALLVMVEGGEEVVIARAGKPIARLVEFERPTQPRRPGAMKGKIWISEDFDAPDPELERLFLEGSIEPAS